MGYVSKRLMHLKTYAETHKSELPPSLEAGQEIKQILKIEEYDFSNAGENIHAVRLMTDNGVFKTTGGVIIEKLRQYFSENTEPLENVRVVQTKSKQGGRRYLDLEGF